MPDPRLRTLLYLHLIVVLVSSTLGVHFWDVRLGASIGSGGGLMELNLVTLAWTWTRILDKKSIAWTATIIVIKYAVLLGSIFYFTRTTWFSAIGAGLGIASFILSALALAAIEYRRESAENKEADKKERDGNFGSGTF